MKPEPKYDMRPYNEVDTWLVLDDGRCSYCGATFDVQNWHPDYTAGWMALIPSNAPTKRVKWTAILDGEESWTDEPNITKIACADCASQLRVSEASLKQDIFADDE